MNTTTNGVDSPCNDNNCSATTTEISTSAPYEDAEVTDVNDNNETNDETVSETSDEAPVSEAPPSTQDEPKTVPVAKKAKKEPKAAKPKVNYPFTTKAQLKEQIENDVQFACQCLEIIYNRQTSHEQGVKRTVNKNAAGFMSSHAVNGSKLVEKYQSGAPLTDDDHLAIQLMASRYTKQLASHMREEAIENDPSLRAVADIFSA